jgi:YfiH family protein
MNVAETLIRWQPHGPYRVAFSTRRGGVSEGEFASLNLGAGTGDDLVKVTENRERLCRALEIDSARATAARQMHGATVSEADAVGLAARPEAFAECDALWSDEPGIGMLLVTADCLPIAIVREDGERPRLAVVHAGWLGLLDGIVDAAVSTLGGGRLSAAIGPAIGPCCYEVDSAVAERFREAYGSAVVQGRRVDLWQAGEMALRSAGCASIERVDLCTSCHPELFFSHRRDGERTGRQGVIAAIG